jgi:hypothetical protein
MPRDFALLGVIAFVNLALLRFIVYPEYVSASLMLLAAASFAYAAGQTNPIRQKGARVVFWLLALPALGLMNYWALWRGW